ncbi:MAG: transcription-repair coupling factor [Clostridia bacterium]|nr:transcription-repair coupling factor [Clostridia bacterium]
MKAVISTNFSQSIAYKNIIRSVEEGHNPIYITGLELSAAALVADVLCTENGSANIIVTATEHEAKRIVGDLEVIASNVYHLPVKEVVFFHSFAHSNEILHERLSIIHKLLSGEQMTLVASVESLSSRQMDRQVFEKKAMTLSIGDVYDLEPLITEFLRLGYERVDRVEGKGMFSLRGGILDYYSPQMDEPRRIEFFDDEIDSIRTFDPVLQTSLEKVTETAVLPAKEILLYNDETFIKSIEKEISGRAMTDELQEEIHTLLENVKRYGYSEKLELFIDYFEKECHSLLDYLPPDGMVIMVNPNRITETSEAYKRGINEKFKDYFERGKLLKKEGNCTVPFVKLVAKTKAHKLLLMDHLQKGLIHYQPQQIIGMRTLEAPQYHGKIENLTSDLKRWMYKGYKVCIFVSGEKKVNNLYNSLSQENVIVEIKDASYDGEMLSGQCFIIEEQLSKGVVFDAIKFVVLSDFELFSVRKSKRRSFDKSRQIIKSYSDLSPGDLVVHESHGVGKYIGIDQLTVDNMKKDYFKIMYSGDDYLYIPIDQMELIQKYIGGEVASLKLNKLGGNEWKRAKSKVKKSIEDMTDELLVLYAERKARRGHAFGQDTDWQRQFEDMFPYEETRDQLKCIEEIKRDMESVLPMDRLLCGDVGFGKTEVAIRAAFKAVMDSKQVAILAPTTLLAQQHYTTLKERFSKFPATVEVLSRFKTKKEQDVILENVRNGTVDVIVGTHRLLSKDVVFKDLGLLVIDEEQRFGVKHKEKIKQLKTNVDVLTLTATPIPRTLHMSLVGVRDMSVIEDPPEDRYPIQTYVVEHDDYLLRDAIDREIGRGGQVFYVYNQVKDIDKIADNIRRLLPHAKVEFAHGQMNEHKLEKIMTAFLEHEFDVLVCTTIIETGLDISNVNTIIIDHADKMGISQLYQLRGRVGRSNRVAYAYLNYSRNKILSEVAEKRLQAIKEFTELGSGFKIAMRDLELRGAGNILGAEQHGHIAVIGYEYYCKLLEQAMRKVKGEVVEDEVETEINYNINAYLPDDYIGNGDYKVEIYKKIAAIRDQQDAFAIEEEIEDRFGTIPTSVYNLINISYAKSLARNLEIVEISEKLNDIVFVFKSSESVSKALLERLMEVGGNRIAFDVSGKPSVRLKFFKRKLTREAKLADVTEFLEKINVLN